MIVNFSQHPITMTRIVVISSPIDHPYLDDGMIFQMNIMFLPLLVVGNLLLHDLLLQKHYQKKTLRLPMNAKYVFHSIAICYYYHVLIWLYVRFYPCPSWDDVNFLNSGVRRRLILK